MLDTAPLTTQLVEALADLTRAQRKVDAVIAALGSSNPAPMTRIGAAVRTTSTQILSVLADAGEPLTLVDIADGVVAIRRGEDEPKRHGGTRYQELCRSSLARLVERGLVERVPPNNPRELMRFRRVSVRP